MGKIQSGKQIAIQKRIEEVMNEEFEKLIAESGDDPLLRLIRQGKLDRLSIEEIKAYLGEEKK
jgi:hypothetical protein